MADPNNNIIKETSDNLANEMREDTGGMSLMSACSNALTIIGLLHSGSYTAAALALGLSGGASIAIPVIVGAAYSLFSTSFISHENAVLITILFLFIVNLTCFSNEYLVIKYYQRNQQKQSNKGHAIFVLLKILL